MDGSPDTIPESDRTAEERPVDPVRAEVASRVREALDLEPGEALDRAYVFDALERHEVAFALALVTIRSAEESGRLQMVAIGSRAEGASVPLHDFVRRAWFPEPLLPSILAELIDRCGVDGAAYRELDLSTRETDVGLETLVDALAPTAAEPA